ncbi:MAG: thrombospondin type 3 repeat-containing protein [Acidobacteriota bacterium]
MPHRPSSPHRRLLGLVSGAVLAASLLGCGEQNLGPAGAGLDGLEAEPFDRPAVSPARIGCDPRSRGFWHRQCLAVGALATSEDQSDAPRAALPAAALDLFFEESDQALLELGEVGEWSPVAFGPPTREADPDETAGQRSCEVLVVERRRGPCARARAALVQLQLNVSAGYLDPGQEVTWPDGPATLATAAAQVREWIARGDCAGAAELAQRLADGAACAGSSSDSDRDGIEDADDPCPFVADPEQVDTDGDGRGDACDLCPLDPEDDLDSDRHCAGVDNCPRRTNYGQEDRDGDGLGDACDPCPDEPTTADDADADGRGDACDPCPGDARNDRDADGHCEAVDNCPGLPNPTQADDDGDGIGQLCDNCPNRPNPDQSDADGDGHGDVCDDGDDGDRDGVFDGRDNCPRKANPRQLDRDGDAVGDACDVCPLLNDRVQLDTDGDGIGDACDTCPRTADADQADRDGDGIGDACDACPGDPENDADLDGRCRGEDNCPGTWNPTQEDVDGDGRGDACDGPEVNVAAPAP